MSKPGDDEDDKEDASFIVYSVPGCSLHICNYKIVPRTELLLPFYR